MFEYDNQMNKDYNEDIDDLSDDDLSDDDDF
jgi:hypothetical protein